MLLSITFVVNAAVVPPHLSDNGSIVTLHDYAQYLQTHEHGRAFDPLQVSAYPHHFHHLGWND